MVDVRRCKKGRLHPVSIEFFLGPECMGFGLVVAWYSRGRDGTRGW
jgi:hypothetical protein